MKTSLVHSHAPARLVQLVMLTTVFALLSELNALLTISVVRMRSA